MTSLNKGSVHTNDREMKRGCSLAKIKSRENE